MMLMSESKVQEIYFKERKPNLNLETTSHAES